MTEIENNYIDKSVLVAGGAGFIGANLITKLLSLGANVRATIHRKGPVIVDERVEYIKSDLLEMSNCRKVVRDMDYVFMCAANTSGAAVIASNPLVHVTPNIIMNSQILEASYFAGVKKFVFLSSNAAYPPTGNRPVREDEMFDDDPYETYYGVGWMKRYTEILCRMYSQKLKNPMITVVIRPSNIYGPLDDYDFATSHVMAAMIRKVAERHNPIIMWGDGNDIRDLIYIDDFIDAVILAAEKVNTYDPINIGAGIGYRLRDIQQMILQIDNYIGAVIKYDTSKPSMIPVRLIDIAKAEKTIGFSPKIGLSEGIGRTLQWYREKYDPASQRQ